MTITLDIRADTALPQHEIEKKIVVANKTSRPIEDVVGSVLQFSAGNIHGIEDIKGARDVVNQARRAGMRIFCITIDQSANDSPPYLFGKQNQVSINKVTDLTVALLGLNTTG